jgi:hypothetical protein
MSQNIDSRFEQLNKKGKAVIMAIVENGGSALTSEIREFSRDTEVIPDLTNSDINYQVRHRLNDGNSSVNGLEIVTTQTPKNDEHSNESKAKIVEIRPKFRNNAQTFVSELQEELESVSLDKFDSIEDAIVSQNEKVAENSEAVKDINDQMESLIEDFKEALAVKDQRIDELEQRVERLEQQGEF